ncbi:MAG: GNAT family N-acetyltransferase [Deltaproteobacteria bacterium]|nr:GNAT family N-acetyltransferase [Deltaproteobacteria bacterium]MBW2394701.1 GNAT family N-acetyltransferase [Deltaproteobacteria bacterium]
MDGPPTSETPQLQLRAYRPSDAEPLFQIQRDPEAMRYTWCAPSLAEARQRLEAYATGFAKDGFAPWTALSRQGNEVVGWGGLNRDPVDPGWGVEVSYFVAPHAWGKGYASEIVGASLALAFGELRLPRVDAFAMPENRASLRVLEKAGFRPVGFVPGLDRNRYRIRAA